MDVRLMNECWICVTFEMMNTLTVKIKKELFFFVVLFCAFKNSREKRALLNLNNIDYSTKVIIFKMNCSK